jgi:hypothetical protein
MKKIRLWLLKLQYRADYILGPFVINERKYIRYLHYMTEQQKKIERLEKELNT